MNDNILYPHHQQTFLHQWTSPLSSAKRPTASLTPLLLPLRRLHARASAFPHRTCQSHHPQVQWSMAGYTGTLNAFASVESKLIKDTAWTSFNSRFALVCVDLVTRLVGAIRVAPSPMLGPRVSNGIKTASADARRRVRTDGLSHRRLVSDW